MNTLRGFDTLIVRGVEYPVRFSTNQTQYFCELEGCDLKGFNDLFAIYETGETDAEGNKKYANRFMEQKVTAATLRNLLLSGLKEGARVQKVPFDMAAEDVGDLMDEMNAGHWTTIARLLFKTGEEAPSPNGPKETPPKPKRKN